MYLILHKVRGEPAFDIAEQLQVGDETWWIIPTSGHRAYPHKTWPLHAITYLNIPAELDATPLPHIQDHYSVNYESTLMSTAPRKQNPKSKSPTLDDLD